MSRFIHRVALVATVAGALLIAAAGATVWAKVSHQGWPVRDGVLWQSARNGQHRTSGTPRNDELLGAHGSDVIRGGRGDDVIWGDELPCCQPTSQHDVLVGGLGDDWLYTSHGTNTVEGGPGNDHIWAYYGSGVIDCGAGDDIARVRTNGAYRLVGCETVRHFCAWGEDA